VRLGTSGSKCVFLAGIDALELPVAHGEGKFVVRDAATLARLREAGQLVLRYTAQEADPASTTAAQRCPSSPATYPDNPNGAMDDLAGICDATGRVFGLMPHPERFVDPTQHPTWTRGPQREVGDGLAVFRNAVRYFL
jgi:phosphoribosylformylglycinamidine synthase subunit PurQ / glutaminase